MTWAQTFTIIITLGGIGISMLAGLWRVYSSTIAMIREDINISKRDIYRFREDTARRDARFREDTARRDARWKKLLQKTYNIEKKSHMLEQEFKTKRNRKRKKDEPQIDAWSC